MKPPFPPPVAWVPGMQWIARANLPGKLPQTSEPAKRARVYDRSMKRGLAVIGATVAALGGCARDDGPEAVPPACSGSPDALTRALSAAPSAVRVDGTAISDCLVKDGSVEGVQIAGSVLVEAARRLGEERRGLALGYLVGALRRGSHRTQGIHAEIVRRVEQEAAPFAGSAAFERGLRAGRSSG
jgi:hypothetical protein